MAGPELLIISAALQAFQGFQAYQAGKSGAKAAKQAANYNAQVTQQQGDIEKQQLRRNQRLFAATQQVKGAGSGATLDSFDDLFESTETQSLLDVALLDYNTKLKKDQIIFGGAQQAFQSKQKGTQGLISGLAGAGTSAAGAFGGGSTTGGTAGNPLTNIGGQNVGTYQSPYS